MTFVLTFCLECNEIQPFFLNYPNILSKKAKFPSVSEQKTETTCAQYLLCLYSNSSLYWMLFQAIFEQYNVRIIGDFLSWLKQYSDAKVIKHFIKYNYGFRVTSSSESEPWIQLLSAQIYQEEDNKYTTT